MKQLLLILLSATLLVPAVQAADAPKGTQGDTVTLSGTIVDNLCADAHKGGMDAFIKSHTKECALMPKCAASGYALYHYGALIRFDEPGSRKIEAFLKKKESRLDVVVVAKKAGDRYTVVSIKNK